MSRSETKSNERDLATARCFYYGWVVVALSFLTNLIAEGIRSAPSVLIHPLEAEFGWSRAAISSVPSLSLLTIRGTERPDAPFRAATGFASA